MAIKRIIFDLDDTLIPWKEEYLNGFKKALEEYNLDIDYKREPEFSNTYEHIYNSYKKEYFLEHFNKTFDQNVKMDFINTWLDNIGEMSEENPEIEDILKYLSKKYELVVLTNHFKVCQEKRLAVARMRNYFLDVIGGDEYMKPNPKSYISAIGNHKPEECIMIGDDLEKDIKGAQKVGLNVIYLTKGEEQYNFRVIHNLKELNEIL